MALKLYYNRLRCIWRNMKARCNKEDAVNYERYGQKGIRVCEEWENSYEAFQIWAIENGYNKTLQIDRIDGDKGYEPSNCRFVKPKIQAINRKKKRTWREEKPCRSKFKGVIWWNNKGRWGKWNARIKINGKQTSLGYFKNEEDAARAYDKKAKEIHGTICPLNFPGE